MANTCHEWTGWRPLRCRQSQILLIVLAKDGGDKGWCLEQRGPICWAELKHPVSVGLDTTTNGEMERRPPAGNALPHFLAMMVRAPRAVDLSAKSALAKSALALLSRR